MGIIHCYSVAETLGKSLLLVTSLGFPGCGATEKGLVTGVGLDKVRGVYYILATLLMLQQNA